MRRTGLLLLLLLLTAKVASANDIHDRWGAGFNFGWMKLVGGEHDYSNVDQHFGLWGRHGLSSKWSIEAAFRFGCTRPGSPRPGEDAGLTLESTHAFYTTMAHGTMGARYHFSPEKELSPYAGFHLGYIDWNVRDENGNPDVKLWPDGETVFGYAESGGSNYLNGSSPTFGLSLGAEYFFSDAVSMDLAARYSRLVDNDLDNVGFSSMWGTDHVDANSGLLEFFLGVTVYFGGSNDKDNDGILNDDDACPLVAEDPDGFHDEDGCPELDNDRDELNDDCDKCPDRPEDMDGFMDEDGCPDPDNDGDGIIDVHDNCPDEPEDLDGFQDMDGCPDPDNDGDGVLDVDDLCPDTPHGMEVDARGCPLVAELKSNVVLEGVTFELGKADLKPTSFTILDNVVKSMLAWPEVTIEIQGHTDNTGSAGLNRDLAQRRSESVMAYMQSRGVEPARMTAVGYGADVPIATNATSGGRAMNRRVELVRTDSR